MYMYVHVYVSFPKVKSHFLPTFTCRDNHFSFTYFKSSEVINNTKQYWVHKFIAHANFLQCLQHF